MTRRPSRQRLRCRWVVDGLIEDLDVGHEVGSPPVEDMPDPEPARPDDEQVEATVVVPICVADLGDRPGSGEGDRALADLAPLTDQDDAEGRRRREAMSNQGAVAILEDVEGQRDAGTEDRLRALLALIDREIFLLRRRLRAFTPDSRVAGPRRS